MKVAVINLERDIEKRKRAEKILTRNNVDYKVFPAIYGKDLPKDYLLTIEKASISFSKKKERCLNPGEIGLYLSHIYIFKWFLKSDLETICILEDDFDLQPNFKECLDEIESKNNFFDFEILMLGHFLDRKDKGILGSLFNQKKGDYLLVERPLEPNYGTHAFVVTRSAAQKIIDKFTLPICPIDHILGISELFDIKRKITSTPIVYQSDLFDSSIQSDGFKNQKILFFYFKRGIKKIVFSLFPTLAIQRMQIYANKNM